MLSSADVKKMFLAYMDAERELDNDSARIEEYEAKLTGIRSVQISDMPKNPSPSDDRKAVYLQRKIELEEKVDRLQYLQEERRKLYLGYIDRLATPDQRAAINMRYMDGNTWDRVNEMIFGKKTDFSQKKDSYMKNVMNYHGQALQQIADMMNEESRE